MAFTAIYFADSPASTAHEAESTSTGDGYLDGRHTIFFSCCNGKDRMYVRERRCVLTCFGSICQASIMMTLRLLKP